jgi:hypothetical protein
MGARKGRGRMMQKGGCFVVDRVIQTRRRRGCCRRVASEIMVPGACQSPTCSMGYAHGDGISFRERLIGCSLGLYSSAAEQRMSLY